MSIVPVALLRKRGGKLVGRECLDEERKRQWRNMPHFMPSHSVSWNSSRGNRNRGCDSMGTDHGADGRVGTMREDEEFSK